MSGYLLTYTCTNTSFIKYFQQKLSSADGFSKLQQRTLADGFSKLHQRTLAN